MSYLQHNCTINYIKKLIHTVYTHALAITKNTADIFWCGTRNVPLSFLLTENESRRPEAPSSPTHATRRCVCAHPWCAPSGRLMGVCFFVCFFSGPTPKDWCIYVKGNAHNKKGMASLAEFLVISTFLFWMKSYDDVHTVLLISYMHMKTYENFMMYPLHNSTVFMGSMYQRIHASEKILTSKEKDRLPSPQFLGLLVGWLEKK